MKSWLRRLRGVLGIGTLWGVAGAVLGPIIGPVVQVVGRGAPLGFYLLQDLLQSAFTGAVTGFVLGSGFAGVITVIERRRTLEELSTARTAVYAALIGTGLPFAFFLVRFGPDAVIYMLTNMPAFMVVTSAINGVLGGALAAGTVSLARRAPPELGPGPVADNANLLGAPSHSVTAV